MDNEYWLMEKVDHLLEKANYQEIPRPRLYNVLKEHNTSEGVLVDVDVSKYEVLRVWTRGKCSRDKSALQRVGSAIKNYLGRTTTTNGTETTRRLFSRVFVAVRGKSEKKLHLKLFKEIPCDKLEHLLPDGKIKMSKFDKVSLSISFILGSSAVAVKLVSFLVDYKLVGIWAVLGVAGLFGARAWVGYTHKRNKYLANLATMLYFSIISNNRGVLAILSDRAVDEEFKEAFLAYVFLLSPVNRRGIPGTSHTADPPQYDTRISLRVRIEDWIRKEFNLRGIHFDMEDALGKLDDLGLLVNLPNGKLSVIEMSEALKILPTPTHQWEEWDTEEDPTTADTQETLAQHGWH